MVPGKGRARARAREEVCVVLVGDRELCVYPLDEFLGVLSKKWAILLVAVLGNRKAPRFTEIADDLLGVTPRALTDRLRDLERAGVVRREVLGTRPVEVRYALTPRGRELRTALVPLIEWSAGRA